MNRVRDLALWFTRLSFARYLGVGAGLAVVDFLLFILLNKVFDVDLRIAQAISRSSAAVLGFFGHRQVTFRATADRRRRALVHQGIAYLYVALALGLVIGPLTIWAAHATVPGDTLIAKIVTDGLMVGFSFGLMRMVFGCASPRIRIRRAG